MRKLKFLRNIFHSIILLSIGFYLSGQEPGFSHEYGNVTGVDFLYNNCEFDSSAEAVVIYDKGKSYFLLVMESFEIVFERQTRIKILNESGLDYAVIHIPYYRKGRFSDEITEIKAATYNTMTDK